MTDVSALGADAPCCPAPPLSQSSDYAGCRPKRGRSTYWSHPGVLSPSPLRILKPAVFPRDPHCYKAPRQEHHSSDAARSVFYKECASSTGSLSSLLGFPLSFCESTGPAKITSSVSVGKPALCLYLGRPRDGHLGMSPRLRFLDLEPNCATTWSQLQYVLSSYVGKQSMPGWTLSALRPSVGVDTETYLLHVLLLSHAI